LRIADALAAVQRGAVREQAEAAVVGFGDLCHAEETAHAVHAVDLDDVVVGEQHEGDDGGERQRIAPEQRRHHQQRGHHPGEDVIVDRDAVFAEGHDRQRRDHDGAEEDRLFEALLRQGEPRPAQYRERDQNWVFGDPVEQIGRRQPGGDASDHAARRHPHVERGEVARRRPPARQLAMAHQRAHEEDRDVDRDLPDHRLEGRGDPRADRAEEIEDRPDRSIGRREG
jgi:hypothetical protein